MKAPKKASWSMHEKTVLPPQNVCFPGSLLEQQNCELGF